MANKSHTLELRGCTPLPLSSYLKSLGVLRIISEQADPHAKGWWNDDVFFLETTLDREQLLSFLLDAYEPTPLVGPWGARSGFFPTSSERTAREALERIVNTPMKRLQRFQLAIATVRNILRTLGLESKADTQEQKRALMMACRNSLPDELLPWLDATYLLLDTETKYPPLLGTGGNERSGSYMSGFAQQVCSVVIDREWDHALAPSLFGVAEINVLTAQTPGQFSPEAAGGPNAGQGFDGKVTTNPWDYLLLLEGTLVFAAAAVKRLENSDGGALGYPFCVRPAGIGYGSAALADEDSSRAEIWLPLWGKPAGLSELRLLFSEGRATVHRRTARTGVDFARAVASLGVDRGIEAFERYGFQQRNGLSVFAIPLGRFAVSRQPQVDLIAELDTHDWLDRFRRAATSKNAPARARVALRQLEDAILDLCQRADPLHLQKVLIALGEAETVMANAIRWRESTFVSPVPLLGPQWLANAHDGSVEFRLAASLASIYHEELGPLRRHLEPVELHRKGERVWAAWSEMPDAPAIVWGEGGLTRNMVAVIRRRMIEAESANKKAGESEFSFPVKGAFAPSFGDIAAFIEGQVDDSRIETLLKGLILVNWDRARQQGVSNLIPQGPREPFPGAAYALLKLCHLPHAVDGQAIRLTPQITHRAAAGDLAGATGLAARRLLASGFPPAVRAVPGSYARGLRTAAALLFPIWSRDTQWLIDSVIQAKSPRDESEELKTTTTETV